LSKLASKSGFAAAAVGTLLLFELVAAWLLFRADDDLVYVLGNPVHYVCAAKQRFGVPCPTCGLTRGFVLTIHGEIGRAWRLSPTGPLAAIGMLGAGIALLALAGIQLERSGNAIVRVEGWLRAGAVFYAVAAVTIWATSWLSTILRMRGHP
jgi:hypothetical protein